MKFKGQGKINICGFEYKKNIADSRTGGFEHPTKNLYPRLAHSRPLLNLANYPYICSLHMFITLGDYTIPKGSAMMVVTYMLHRDPKHYPDPERFDPDRFTLENSIKRHPFAYTPFSAGQRNCIGQRNIGLNLISLW